MAPLGDINSRAFGLVLFETPFRVLSSRGWAGHAYAAIDQGTDATDVSVIIFRIGVSGALGKLMSAWVWLAEKRGRLERGVY